MYDAFRHHLRTLTAVPGLAGHEDAVIALMAEGLAAYADEVQIDGLGNVLARFGEGAPRLAILAHMDTVGLMVQRLLARSAFGVVAVGGVNVKALYGVAVRLHTADGPRQGLIGVRAQHQARSTDSIGSADDLYVETDGQPVEITTPITFAPQFIESGRRISAPYLDNRAGCALLLALAQRLQAQPAPQSVVLVATVQEETTCLGAYLALQAIQPEAALFIDGTLSHDSPDTVGRGAVALGAGPVLTAFLYVSGLNAWHAHPVLRQHLKSLAHTCKLPVQQDAAHGLMSDARAVSWTGTPSALLGLPLRGKHGPLETIDLDDLTHALILLEAFARHPLPNLARGQMRQ
ncbi:MAG: M20/M25/M40 family metallo-hydrolase [Anaerolineae bacterium]|nr:M20/M25/M40 family metallo-hydrolase [Anaerolineae bacterium]MDW8172040.1 M20/M25/M40 family metallo-hydrolase [Anaerolineae bacterium]